MKTQPSLSPVVAALLNVRPSGDHSFEELTLRWLSRLSGERMRRCKAGDQGGVDAVAEIPFAIEDKRHATDIASRALVGGLTTATIRYPDLQLWVLVATCAVAEQTYKDVKDAARTTGIAILILDATSAQPELPEVSSIAALAATDIDTTMRFLTEPEWRTRGEEPNLAAVRRELTAIRELPAFRIWEARLRNELRDLPTWRRLVRSQNHRLYSLILHDAANAFDTPYNHEQAVPRTAEAELTAWWESCRPSGRCEIAVVTGERYEGKTWLIFQWLRENLHSFSLPVFFFPSRKVKDEGGKLGVLIMREAEEALGSSFRRHAQAIIDRHRSRGTGTGPWCLVILDGANEYGQMSQALSEAVMWAHPSDLQPLQRNDDGSTIDEQPTETARRCALVITCRKVDFAAAEQRLGGRTNRCIELLSYDDHELTAALEKASVTKSEFESLPADAQRMARQPRYLALTLLHWQKLGRFGGATSNTLIYLDAVDKVLPREASVRFEPELFKEFLANLADRWRREKTLDYSTFREEVAALTQEVDAHVKELISSGVVTAVDGKIVPDLDKLALGMGLFIRDELRSLHDRGLRVQALRDILEPHGDDDEKVRWLRAAVTTSVFAADDSSNPDLLDHLLSEWLSARNFSAQDLDELRNLTPFVFKSVLRMTFAGPVETSLVLIAEAMIHTEIAYDERPVANAVHRWLRLISTDLPLHLQEGTQPPDFRRKAEDSSLCGLDLEIQTVNSETIHKLQRLGLFLAYGHPTLVRPVDVLALLAGRNAADDYLDEGERFAVRKILAEGGPSWYEHEVRSWAEKPEVPRTICLRNLIECTGRGDLRHLLDQLPEPQWRNWSQATLAPSELAALEKSDDAKQVLRTAENAQYLALDPASAPPPRPWRTQFADVATTRFRGSVIVSASRSETLDDLDLRDVEPALAAWVPKAGARIWRAFLADIPRRMANSEQSWSWAVDGHAALITRADRRALLNMVLRSLPMRVKNSQVEHAFQQAYRCAMVGSSSSERLSLLLDHPFDREWTRFYEVVAAASDKFLRRKTLHAVRVEREPRRLKRARILLGYLRAVTLSAEDLSYLVADLSDGDSGGDPEYAARFLLKNCRVDDATPRNAFGPLVRVAESLKDTAWQYVAFLDRKRFPGAARSADWIALALSAPETARSNGADAGVSDDVGVAQGVERLALQILARLQNKTSTGRTEQFPKQLAGEISEAAFDGWVDQLLSSPPHALHFHSGLLLPVVRRALQTRHPSAKDLWKLAYPFRRSTGTRFTVYDGVDWTLEEIHDASLDDGLALELLREVVADCRSDSELVAVALGARLVPVSRMMAVVEQGLDSHIEVDRAKARFIAGWMAENHRLRERLEKADESTWVTRIGEEALQRLNRERWAREWLRRFLYEKSTERRWAAGRLFLQCSDAATRLWARDVLADDCARATRRAEARLLLDTIRKKVEDSELRDNFLGYRVGQLAGVVPPWRQEVGWGDIGITDQAL